jgi:hypothetical protein
MEAAALLGQSFVWPLLLSAAAAVLLVVFVFLSIAIGSSIYLVAF